MFAVGHPGANAIRFRGRLADGHLMRPGAYMLTAMAITPAGQSISPKRLRFRILRG
jgi:hypothetical protein